MSLSEGLFKRRVIQDLDTLKNCYHLKTQEVGRKGVPDILMCLAGRFVAIELKREGEKPTKLQEYVLQEIQKAGGLAFCATPERWPVQFKQLEELDYV